MIKKNHNQINLFNDFPTENQIPFIEEDITISGYKVKRKTGEFWTGKQRQASTIHEVSYRACFKPQLPNYFITRFTKNNEIVYDPFGGRGTTCVEAAILGRKIIQNDINPLSVVLAKGRLSIPSLKEINDRLEKIDFNRNYKCELDLSMFYHEKTFNEILAIKNYLCLKIKSKKLDNIDSWIRMVATNRLTGHSPGFFSVYTMPPNQAVSAKRQQLINEKRGQKPTYRDTKQIILKKSKQLLGGLTHSDISNLQNAAVDALFLNKPANLTSEIKSSSVSLVVTSPPFLNIVQYKNDNWLRCWFNGIDAESVGKLITMSKTLDDWAVEMKKVLNELYRVVKKGGYVAFEVGEIKNGKIKLDEVIIPLGIDVGFSCEYIMINSQKFTKTSNIWGVSNNLSGTNSNRIVVLKK